MLSLAIDSTGDQVNYQTAARSGRKEYFIGIALLLAVVLLWTLSSFITQALFEDGYHKPFLVTYLNTSSFTLYLLPLLIRYLWRRRHDEDVALQGTRWRYETLPTSENETLEVSPSDNEPHSDDISSPTAPPPLTTTETAHLASIFCVLWFIANWSGNAALGFTSVTSATILASTSGFFTLVVGRVFGVESLTPAKIAAVVASFIGVLLVSLSDGASESDAADPTVHVYKNALLGDILVLLTAIFYAIYVIVLKVRIPSEAGIDMQLFFGFVGVFSILLMFPMGVVLHFTGYEHFELPSSEKLWGAVLVNMATTLASDYIYVIAMLRTTPVVVTIGLSLTIPLAVVGDSIQGQPAKAQAGWGALLVLGGFALAGWENSVAETQQPAALGEDAMEMSRRRGTQS